MYVKQKKNSCSFYFGQNKRFILHICFCFNYHTFSVLITVRNVEKLIKQTHYLFFVKYLRNPFESFRYIFVKMRTFVFCFVVAVVSGVENDEFNQGVNEFAAKLYQVSTMLFT